MSLLSSASPILNKGGHSLFTTAMALVGCAILGGCATEPVPSGSRFVVSARSAEFYKNGPAQDMVFQSPQMSSLSTSTTGNFGPDAQLPKGTSVTMLKREVGYSRVATDEGAIGYVSNDQLQRAPAIAQFFVERNAAVPILEVETKPERTAPEDPVASACGAVGSHGYPPTPIAELRYQARPHGDV